MDAHAVIASIDQVDRMLDRVEKVIGRERPEKSLRPDVSYPRRAKPQVRKAPVYAPKPQRLQRDTGYSSEVVASGQLAGNEMRLSDYKYQPSEDDDPTGMWATFETEFDAMVAGMR